MTDTFLTRLNTVMQGSILADADRADLRLRVLADHFASGEAQADDLQDAETALAAALDDASLEAIDSIASRLSPLAQASDALIAAFVARGSVATAVAIAGRARLSGTLATSLFRRPERDVLIALLRNPDCHLDRATASWLISRARHDRDLARALLARGPVACDLTPLFLMADADVRARILAEARRRDLGALPASRRVPPASLVASIEQAMARDDRVAIIDALARDQRISRQDCEKIVDDQSGEACALLLNVVGVSPALATKLLTWLTASPANGSAVAALERLAIDLPSLTARHVISAIIGRSSSPGHAPLRDVPRRATDYVSDERPSVRPARRETR